MSTTVDVPPPAADTTAPDDGFEALYARVGDTAYRLALTLLRDGPAAEDVVQEAFLRVFGRREALTPPLDAYLLRTVRNLALDQRRRRVVEAKALAHTRRLVRLRPAAGDGPDVDALERALAELPVEQREVVVLHAFEGWTFPRIAEHTDAPLGTVHSRHRYALKRLETLLGVTP